MRKYISLILLCCACNIAFAQTKVDSLRLLNDVNGGAVAFTPMAVNAVTFGNGYGANNSAFIALLRAYTTSTLPINLYSITAVREINNVTIKWITASESNSDYFEVLKSSDGKTFTAMGVVSASGSSNALLNYSFKDVSPISGTNYYQLNMVDKDGTSKKSTVVCANFDIEKADFNVSTNATKGTISLSVYSSRSKQAGFEVFDLQSRTLLKENLRLNEGINIFKFKLSVAPNMIIVRLNTEGDVQTKKLYF